MKAFIRLLPLLLTMVIIFPGCASVGDSGNFIQQVLDKVLPADFTGYIKATHHNQYFTLSFEGDGLKRTESGWTWRWLQYERTGHIPLAPGLSTGSSGLVTLGKRD